MIFELTLSDKKKEAKLLKECLKARDKIEKCHEPVVYRNGYLVRRDKHRPVERLYHYYVCDECGKKNRYTRIKGECNHIKTYITIRC